MLIYRQIRKIVKGKVFNKSLLLDKQEERAAYWIKKYEEVIMAFE